MERKMPQKQRFQNTVKTLIVYIGVASLLFFLFFGVTQTSQLTQKEIPLSQLITDVRKGEVEKVLVEGDKLTVTYKDGSKATSRKEASESLVKTFETEKIPLTSIEMEVKDQAGSQLWWNFLLNGLPILLMILLFVFIFRQARGASDSLFSFGQSRARLF
ncbi:MAG TPA: ATP-dependent metallopeptidase FtsH/Yme1/Tma family protein, partial [Patescibacteria group bacterium]|nr:ATP-dependent metallopeptidase FtsH/Yme1/Tma family protein [Patescibacteria group bacterium]